MKRLLLSILPVFLVLAAFGQDKSLSRNDGPIENGPVIININAYKNSGNSIVLPFVKSGEIKLSDVSRQMTNTNEADTDTDLNKEDNKTNFSSGSQDLNIGFEATDQNQKLVKKIKEDLNVYPIPAVSDLKISLGQEVNAELNLMNILGQTVYSFTADDLSNHTISVNNYPSGTYFLVIKIDNERITKRVQIR